jgi:hypothetical protein
MREVKVLIPAGILGYSYLIDVFEEALEEGPDVIAVDGGSIDPGPYYLGTGESFLPRLSTKIDLAPMMRAAKRLGIPVIVTSVGGQGSRQTVEWFLDLADEVAKEMNEKFTVATPYADIPKDWLCDRVRAGRVMPFMHDEPLTEDVVRKCTAIVGQMGHEPIIEALETGAELIFTGRAMDLAAISAYPIHKGFDVGLASHMGQILECGSRALVRTESRRTPVYGVIRDDHFLVVPVDAQARASVKSVATHMMYEERDPVMLGMPGGTVDCTSCIFTELDGRIVEVRGSKFVKSDKYMLKLEGASLVGKRCIIVGGTRSPEMISQIDAIISKIRQLVQIRYGSPEEMGYQLHFRLYGKNAILGDLERTDVPPPHELGIVTEVVAPTQVLADDVCHYVAGVCLHHLDFPGNLSEGGGNMAFIGSPLETGRIEAYDLSIHHLVELDDPCEVFPVEVRTIG